MNLEFEKFVKSFDMNDENIIRKYRHSLRVQKLCEELGESRCELASVIGLLHDYGRFYQWSEYKTFNDKMSIDHADYAVYKLFEENEIEKFYKNDNDYKIIYDAIRYHNKYSIGEDACDKFMCGLIRDADKLDLLYMYEICDLKLLDGGTVSDKVNFEFYNHNLIKFNYVKSKIDRSINILSFVFDLNLIDSYYYLKKNRIYEKIYEKIENKEIFDNYFLEVENYIDLKIREDDKNVRKKIQSFRG